MKLKQFRIQNYRSINDSKFVNVGQLTALLGRNESGKSNLLRALHGLNPSGGIKPLKRVKDFPRHRKSKECTDSTPVVSTEWGLDGRDVVELANMWPDDGLEDVWPIRDVFSLKDLSPHRGTATSVWIYQAYDGSRSVGFKSLTGRALESSAIESKAQKIVQSIEGEKEELRLGDAECGALKEAVDQFQEVVAYSADAVVWGDEVEEALKNLRQVLKKAGAKSIDLVDDLVAALMIVGEEKACIGKACIEIADWTIKRMPTFTYLDEYPQLNGEQNVVEFFGRKKAGKQTLADINFAKMCKVAGLDPRELQDLLNAGNTESRRQHANLAGLAITREIRRLWKNRQLKVRFNVDAHSINTLVSDALVSDSIEDYEVEINLNECSRGFQWFFSFYVIFAADTDRGTAKNIILLLDEPGLFLHAKSQRDLMTHLEKDFKNQVLYTTHSPFMVPTHRLDFVRTVSIDEGSGTTVSNDPSGDAHTLFPLQAALGYDLAQSLFVGQNNVVVEGITDYWALSSISERLNDIGCGGLRADITITPAGGAQKIPYMVHLLSSENLNVLVLLDNEKAAKDTRNELVKSKAIKSQCVIFISEAFDSASQKKQEADIEDLLDPKIYENLVRESYKEELKDKDLNLNEKVPRIAKRFDLAFGEIDLEFHKTRPMRLLLDRMGSDPDSVMTEEVIQRFRLLAKRINAHYEKDDQRT